MPYSKNSYCLPFLLSEISDPGSRAFTYPIDGIKQEGFVVRRGQQIYAYRNKCPHTGVTLNWSEHVFLDSEDKFIQCAMHGALFLIDSGECIRGPCAGDCLQKLEVTMKSNGQLFIDVDRKKPL